jgi:hypothetical protein
MVLRNGASAGHRERRRTTKWHCDGLASIHLPGHWAGAWCRARVLWRVIDTAADLRGVRGSGSVLWI